MPQSHLYLPPANFRTGVSVVICSGGGFSILGRDLEGAQAARWFTSQVIAAVVLKYRAPARTQYTPWSAPTQDAQRKISLILSRAADRKLDKHKVGVRGFSAGGVAAVKTALADERHYEPFDQADQESHLPNRAILLYSGGLPGDIQDPTPATFNIKKRIDADVRSPCL